MRAFVTPIVSALVFAAALSAQVPRRPGQPPVPEAPPPAPQFKSSVDVVHLDVSVLDRNRRPVRGLRPADFTILEEGKSQEISVFEAVDLQDVEAPTAEWQREVAPDVRVNTDVQERRLFLLILDDSTIQASPRALNTARDIARNVIDGFHESDLAAVVFTRDNRNAQDFTADRARLRAAVNKFSVGFRDMGLEASGKGALAGQDDGYFVGSSSTLERAVLTLSQLPDRRKSIIYVGQGIPANLDDTGFAAPGLPPGGGSSALMAQALNSRIKTQIDRVFTEARRANVNVYTIDACGLRVVGEMLRPSVPICVPGLEVEYLRILADNTGGRAIVETNDFKPGVKAILEENASYYLLGFHPGGGRQDGKFRRLEVRVNRPDVTVRTRNGYRAEKAGDVARRTAALESSSASVALAGILPKSDLPL